MDHSRRPSEDARALLRRSLRAESATLAFAESVLVQVARPPGAPPDPTREQTVAARIRALVDAADRPADAEQPGPEHLLASDPELLAAFFQNVDLLYAADDPSADRISGWIMGALEILDRRGPG